MSPWCLLLTGLPNSGKSTLAYNLVQARLRNALIIDGDKHREMQFLGKKLSFSENDILENTKHVIKLGIFAQEQGINVIIPQIAPYLEHRKLMRLGFNGFYEIYCKCSNKGRSKRPNFKHSNLIYQYGNADLIVDTEKHSMDECIKYIKINWLGEEK